MKYRLMISMGIILLLCLVLQSCGGAPVASATNLPQQTTQPTPTAEMPTNTATQPPVIPTATTTPAPTRIQHVTRPGTPSYILEETIGDCIEGETYNPNRPVFINKSCDVLSAGLVERPVTQDMNNYFPYLDIVRTQFGSVRDWYFVRIVVFNTVEQKGDGDLYYFVKIDVNADGRYSNVALVSVKNLPLSTGNWTTNGVQAWTDVEGTVTLVFDQGAGSDPDLIWARRSPKVIEFAFKPALVNNATRFAWFSWAYQGTQTPPDLALVLSIPDLYLLDNTCAIGFNLKTIDLVNQCIK